MLAQLVHRGSVDGAAPGRSGAGRRHGDAGLTSRSLDGRIDQCLGGVAVDRGKLTAAPAGAVARAQRQGQRG
ncbi:MAG: hypothetical protein MUD13_12415, partial [Candidatus Nanopelagicales bacterium]|nr:hypothetical protein [Candidatus Nanopelagicales bacterium]